MIDRLRVGILCDSMVFQGWQAECIRQVLAVPGVEPVLLVMNANAARTGGSAAHRVLRHPWRMALYLQWRRRRFRPDAMRGEDLTTLLNALPKVECVTERKGFGEYFNTHDLDAVRAHRPDVLLRFGFNIIRGDILSLPRFGVWSYHHGDEEKYRGGPPGFWEIMDGDPVTGAILQRLTDKLDGGRVLRKGWFQTIDHSLCDTVDAVLMHSAPWAANVCRELLAGNDMAAQGTESTTTAPVRKYPGNGAFISFLFKHAENKARFHKRELTRHEEWNLGVLYQPIASLLKDKPSLNVRWLPHPDKGQYRADPFGYMKDGELNVLYEKYDYALGKGLVSRVRPKKDNVLKRSRTMLEADDHFSYPFVLERDGEVYVIPETASRGRVDLHRVNDANDAIEFVRTLLDEPLYDPTVFEHEGRWWILGTKAPLTNVELFAYHSDRLEGPYTPHILNPVKCDIRSARPGGTPFTHEGGLYRPAQDSSHTYGGRVAINRVAELTPVAFREETVKTIGPLKGTPWNLGLHTLSAVDGVTLIDGKRYVTVKAQRKRVGERKFGKLLPGAEADDDDAEEDD